MRILHFSDTHLGFQAFDRVNDAGVNTREQDVYDAFEKVVRRILEVKPDLVIHSGDFFHRPSPSNRALTFGLEQLRIIGNAGIPMVIIAGNHETPKTIYNSPILRALNTLDLVYPVFGESWEKQSFGEVVVHGVPHINDQRILFQELEKLHPEPGKFNILMLHTSLGKRFLMEEYGEQIFPPAFETKLAGFQYIALGHWHNMQAVQLHSNAWYSGSIERLSDTEIDSEKGFLWLDISPDHSCKVHFEAIATRPWLRWEQSNCSDLSVAELETSLLQFQETQSTLDAILSITFNDIRPEQTLELGNIKLRQLFPEAFQIIPKRKTASDRTFVQGIESHQFDRLDKVFADYLQSKFPDDARLAQQLIERASRYFHTENL